MGNCQAIDNATLLLQHPNGRVDKMYTSVSAAEIMKMHPAHYVALLLTTTLYHSSPTPTLTPTPNKAKAKTITTNNPSNTNKNKSPVRITRIKLLKPTDTLALGHVYRLITTQEVMKGLWAKKCGKMKQQSTDLADGEKAERLTAKEISELEEAIKKYEVEKINKAKHEKQRSRVTPASNSATSKSRIWHPSLKSISEAAGS